MPGIGLRWRSTLQTTPHEHLGIGAVTVTMPIHPMEGAQLDVISVVQRRDGRSGVLVELADHTTLLLPLEWTDRSAPFVAPVVHGQAVRVSFQSLQRLSRGLERGRLASAPSSAEVAE